MSPKDFYDMLPRYFWHKMDGFYELENNRQRQHWERSRWQTTLLLNIQLIKGKCIKPTDLIKFDWDDKEKDVKDYEKLKNRAEYIKRLEDYGK